MCRLFKLSPKAFTLTEIMTVVVILGVLGTIGMPKLSGQINRARARDAMNNLSLIHSANVLYRVHHSNTNFDCTGGGGCLIAEINSINGTNSLNIISTGGTTYSCNGVNCTATNTNGTGFVVTVVLANTLSATNPSCSNSGSDQICP